ncbi:digestive cysteine proteinase 1-like [Homarus americanus]|uniref:Digestive cysteine proteinase 1-like 3 n=1 Tax=Homarus americanus TaxID=6706 RepID=A0A8J5J7Y2_HOMAM|nr:digestive cysteine proteinase 1-like [Homarus americanus]KAG7153916.1 Digestive cysteine proteinase 1-like 3 [Homarus americanus]
MKVAVLFLFGVALASASPAFKDFKGKFGRKYVDLEEERYRLNVFLDNLQYIEEFNKKYERGEVTYNLAINQFSDMTNDEFNSMMKGYKTSLRPKPVAVFTSTDAAPETTEVDWRTQGAVTPVKDQGQCGSCWAFSTTGSLEGQHFLKNGELVSLSEQQLVDCAGGIYFNQGCNGGWVNQAFKYIKHNGGVDTEASYPYEARDNTCRFNSNSVGATCTGFVSIAQGSESALMTATRDIGPISVAIDASHRSFQSYSSGVYYEPSCSSSQLDHAVLAVGYGSEGGQDFWLVKNSWSTSWGENGYINMARNRNNNCGIATDASYPTV